MRLRWCFLLLLNVLSCDSEQNNYQFINRSASRTGVNFINAVENTTDLNILKYLYFYNGAGVAAGDFNNDGLADLYFTSNLGPDRLFINQGNLKFIDVTESSKIENDNGWTNGVTTCDINGDGLLDLYICKTSGYLDFKGHNLLLVNQGIIDGVPVFKEVSKDYGLAFSGFSTQSSFLDFDLDGDLDLYLMNHSVHPNRNYGKGNVRNDVSEVSGDKLYENRNGYFFDVTESARIFQGKIGYGLGLAVGDLNNDRYPDIYVGNDFFENDYLYINQQDGSFKDQISLNPEKLGHTTHFSMGNAIKDVNNDGYLDIISLDMLPSDSKTYKRSGLDYPFQTYNQYLKNGYAPQFMQNTLHLNSGFGHFSEIAKMSGISATDWSWSPLVADFDNDGWMDLYITNGILGATNDMDFINFISSEKIQRKIDAGLSENDLSLMDAIPKQKRQNYFFHNKKNLKFEDVSNTWLADNTSFSNGATYADLDNDGDLDIVVNNINEVAFILENNQIANHFINFKFVGTKNNRLGIGAKVTLFSNGDRFVQENYTTQGYLSAKMPQLHFGLDSLHTNIDSVQVIWPNGAGQTIVRPKLNSNLVLNAENANENITNQTPEFLIQLTQNDSLIPFKHEDRLSLDYNIDPLIPFSNSNEGPSAVVGDINADQLEDVIIGGAKGQPTELFIQMPNGTFTKNTSFKFKDQLPIAEVTSMAIADLDNNGYLDLVCGYGGNEFTNGNALQPTVYFNNGTELVAKENALNDIEVNASQVSAIDLDLDGDLDLAISSDILPRQFGISSRQFIFENDGHGNMFDRTDRWGKNYSELGNVKHIDWVDINDDGYPDAIVAGYWMPITILLNNNGQSFKEFEVAQFKDTNGWWNFVKTADFDNDGDLDIIAGNWGLNTRLTASKERPITLYVNDFDENGKKEPILTYYQNGKEDVFGSKDDMVKALPYLNKKFLSYQTFSEANLKDLFSDSQLKASTIKSIFELGSCYFENVDNTFLKKQLPNMFQISSIHDMLVEDFNQDGYMDLFVVGNTLDLNTQLGSLDASHGQLLLNDTKGFFKYAPVNVSIAGSSRQAVPIKTQTDSGYLILRNNDTPIFISKND